MDLLGFLRGKGRVDNTIPPAEAAVHAEVWRAREARIAAIDAQIFEALQYGAYEVVDRLLDARNAIRPGRDPMVRPSVPVIPGRTT